MPSQPQVFEFVGIAAFPHDLLDGGNVEAVIRLAAIFAFAVVRIHRNADLRHLFSQRRIFRSGRGQGQPQQHEFAGQIWRHRKAVKTLGLFDQLRRRRRKLILGIGRQRFRVVRNKVFLYPTGSSRLDFNLFKTGFCLFHELLSLGDSGFRCGLSLNHKQK